MGVFACAKYVLVLLISRLTPSLECTREALGNQYCLYVRAFVCSTERASRKRGHFQNQSACDEDTVKYDVTLSV